MKKKILYLMPYIPTPRHFGGALRMYHILDHLCAHYDVTVAGFSESGDLDLFREEFPELDGKMHFIKRRKERFRKLRQVWAQFTPHSYWYNWSRSGRMQKRIEDLVRQHDFDFIISEFASMGHFEFETDAIRILDAHNVEYDNFRRMSQIKGAPLRKRFYEREYRLSYDEEVAAFNRHDVVFATSKRDADLIKKDAESADVFVIPNGVDTDYFRSTEQSEAELFSMVFTGAMRYLPNNEGMLYFIEEIFPLIKDRIPNAKIYVVGSNPPDELKAYNSKSIVVTGFVDDVRPFVEGASVCVVPLNMGSGTRLKILEAFSMKKPVVSTSIGCEGLEVEDGVHLLIRDEPAAFADAVVTLFKEPELKSSLSFQGHELVKNSYDWAVVGKSIDEALQTLYSAKKQKHKFMIDENVSPQSGIGYR